MSKTLIYNPSNAIPFNVSSGVPVEAYSSPIRFPRAISRGSGRATGKGTLEPVETKGMWLYPGTNTGIPDEEFDYISRHPVGGQLISRGALKLVEPKLEEGKTPTNTTSDYAEPDALDLIRNSYDLSWLELSSRREDRPRVSSVLIDRIKALSTDARR